MRSKTIEKLLRLLLVLLGIGIGLALAQLGLALYRLSYQNTDIPAWVPVATYTGMGILKLLTAATLFLIQNLIMLFLK